MLSIAVSVYNIAVADDTGAPVCVGVGAFVCGALGAFGVSLFF